MKTFECLTPSASPAFTEKLTVSRAPSMGMPGINRSPGIGQVKFIENLFGIAA